MGKIAFRLVLKEPKVRKKFAPTTKIIDFHKEKLKAERKKEKEEIDSILDGYRIF